MSTLKDVIPAAVSRLDNMREFTLRRDRFFEKNPILFDKYPKLFKFSSIQIQNFKCSLINP